MTLSAWPVTTTVVIAAVRGIDFRGRETLNWPGRAASCRLLCPTGSGVRRRRACRAERFLCDRIGDVRRVVFPDREFLHDTRGS